MRACGAMVDSSRSGSLRSRPLPCIDVPLGVGLSKAKAGSMSALTVIGAMTGGDQLVGVSIGRKESLLVFGGGLRRRRLSVCSRLHGLPHQPFQLVHLVVDPLQALSALVVREVRPALL